MADARRYAEFLGTSRDGNRLREDPGLLHRLAEDFGLPEATANVGRETYQGAAPQPAQEIPRT